MPNCMSRQLGVCLVALLGLGVWVWFVFFSFPSSFPGLWASRTGLPQGGSLSFALYVALLLQLHDTLLDDHSDCLIAWQRRTAIRAPPQGQESCRIDLSRHCTGSSEHHQMARGCCCEDWGSMMFVFQAVEITPALLCHRYIDACAVVSDKMFSYKLHFFVAWQLRERE